MKQCKTNKWKQRDKLIIKKMLKTAEKHNVCHFSPSPSLDNNKNNNTDNKIDHCAITF